MTRARLPYPPPPRPSDGSASPPPEDLVAARLEYFAASTTVLPRPDLHARVLGRLAEEPRTSAPRRFRAALLALDVSAAIRSFRQVLATATAGRPTTSGPRASVAVRAQAVALVLLVTSVVVLAGTAGGVGAVAGIAAIIDGERVTQPDVPVVGLPSPSPIDDAPAVVELFTPEPTIEPTIEPTPPPKEARPATRDATPKPASSDSKPRATARPSKDDRDTRSDDREDPTPNDDGDDREENPDRDGGGEGEEDDESD